MRANFRFLAKNARKWPFLLQKWPFFHPKMAILRTLLEFRKTCAQSFDFWRKMPENGHFCSKSGHFAPKSGHFCAHCTSFTRDARKVSIFGQKCLKMAIFALKLSIFHPKVAFFSRKSPPPRAGGDYTSKSHPRHAQTETGPRKSHLRPE